MNKNEAMQLALTILLEYYEKENGLWGRAEDAIDALLAALAQPEKIECSRSHPHENMGSHCQLQTEIARLTNENARLKAKPETEPVAWMHKFIDDVITKNRPTDITRNAGRWTALYTAPPQRKPLSDDEMFAVFDNWSSKPEVTMADLCRAVEAAHGIKD